MKRGCDETSSPEGGGGFNLSTSLWFELIFKPHFTNLVDLIAVKRVCVSFASFKLLRKWIKSKEQLHYGGIDKQYWNRYSRVYIKDKDENRFMDHHPTKWMVYFSHVRYSAYPTRCLGLYHCKEDLLAVVCKLISDSKSSLKKDWKSVWNGFSVRFLHNSLSFIYVQGLALEEIKELI